VADPAIRVVESVVSAKRFEDRVHDPSKLDLSQTLEGNLKPSSTSQLDAVSVTLDIARRENWVIDISVSQSRRFHTFSFADRSSLGRGREY